MARTRMVTRTITVTTVTALTVDVLTQTVANTEFELSGYTYTEETALKTLKKTAETDTLKIVSIVSLAEHEEIYGLLETEFLKVAHKLDNERKFIDDEDDAE